MFIINIKIIIRIVTVRKPMDETRIWPLETINRKINSSNGKQYLCELKMNWIFRSQSNHTSIHIIKNQKLNSKIYWFLNNINSIETIKNSWSILPLFCRSWYNLYVKIEQKIIYKIISLIIFFFFKKTVILFLKHNQ